MVLVKIPAGHDALKDRHGPLTSRQRAAFILFDGRRSMGEILAATTALGITPDDIQIMIAQGLLTPLPAQSVLPVADATDLGTVSLSDEEDSGRSAIERYQQAYPIATELTASLGLRGFRLNLAVEGAGSFEDLAALAPKIRDAVGAGPFKRLQVALFD